MSCPNHVQSPWFLSSRAREHGGVRSRRGRWTGLHALGQASRILCSSGGLDNHTANRKYHKYQVGWGKRGGHTLPSKLLLDLHWKLKELCTLGKRILHDGRANSVLGEVDEPNIFERRDDFVGSLLFLSNVLRGAELAKVDYWDAERRFLHRDMLDRDKEDEGKAGSYVCDSCEPTRPNVGTKPTSCPGQLRAQTRSRAQHGGDHTCILNLQQEPVGGGTDKRRRPKHALYRKATDLVCAEKSNRLHTAPDRERRYLVAWRLLVEVS